MAISMAMSDTDRFMDKFDPVNSNREKRKKMRTQPGSGGEGNSANGKRKNKRDQRKSSRPLYSEKGLLLHDEFDQCDCLNDNCPGCFFPCPKCRSPKCGIECRIHRRWVLETISVDGTSVQVENAHLPPQ